MAHEAKTVINMPELNKPNGEAAQMQFTTDVYNGKLISTAQIVFLQPDGCITFEIFGDYNKRFKQLPSRGTQKNIDNQHAETFTDDAIAGIKDDALKFYEAKHKKEEDAA